MSIEAMSLVWKYSKQSGTLLLLELALADYANERNIAWPSVNTLAKKIRMSRRYTINMLEKLESSKEIKVVEAGDPTHSNHYLITIKPTKKQGSEPEFTSEAGLTGVVRQGSLGSEAGDTRVVRRGTKGSEAGLTLTTKNHQVTINESINQPPPQEKAGSNDKKSPSVVAAVVDGHWNLEGLLDLGKVYRTRRISIPADMDPRLYVSNYLYAITQKGFHKPPSFWAASRIWQGKPGGDPFDELARLAPERLAFILHWSADPFSVSLDGDELLAMRWRSAWAKGVDAGKVQQAIIELGLSAFVPEPARSVSDAENDEPDEPTDFHRWCDLLDSLYGNKEIVGHMTHARFLNANGAVHIEVADQRIKAMLETAMPLIAPKVTEVFGEIKLEIETRQ